MLTTRFVGVPPTAVVILVLAAACDTRMAEEPAVRWTLERLESDVKALATAGDPTFACAAVRQAIAELAGNRKAHVVGDVKTARARCREALLAFAEARADAAADRAAPPATRASRPPATRASPPATRASPPKDECVDLARALHILGDLAPDDPALTELDRRRKTVCN